MWIPAVPKVAFVEYGEYFARGAAADSVRALAYALYRPVEVETVRNACRTGVQHRYQYRTLLALGDKDP
jgi:hypothetical protein